jgi:hypothetical protein
MPEGNASGRVDPDTLAVRTPVTQGPGHARRDAA